MNKLKINKKKISLASILLSVICAQKSNATKLDEGKEGKEVCLFYLTSTNPEDRRDVLTKAKEMIERGNGSELLDLKKNLTEAEKVMKDQQEAFQVSIGRTLRDMIPGIIAMPERLQKLFEVEGELHFGGTVKGEQTIQKSQVAINSLMEGDVLKSSLTELKNKIGKEITDKESLLAEKRTNLAQAKTESGKEQLTKSIENLEAELKKSKSDLGEIEQAEASLMQYIKDKTQTYDDTEIVDLLPETIKKIQKTDASTKALIIGENKLKVLQTKIYKAGVDKDKQNYEQNKKECDEIDEQIDKVKKEIAQNSTSELQQKLRALKAAAEGYQTMISSDSLEAKLMEITGTNQKGEVVDKTKAENHVAYGRHSGPNDTRRKVISDSKFEQMLRQIAFKVATSKGIATDLAKVQELLASLQNHNTLDKAQEEMEAAKLAEKETKLSEAKELAQELLHKAQSLGILDGALQGKMGDDDKKNQKILKDAIIGKLLEPKREEIDKVNQAIKALETERDVAIKAAEENWKRERAKMPQLEAQYSEQLSYYKVLLEQEGELAKAAWNRIRSYILQGDGGSIFQGMPTSATAEKKKGSSHYWNQYVSLITGTDKVKKFTEEDGTNPDKALCASWQKFIEGQIGKGAKEDDPKLATIREELNKLHKKAKESLKTEAEWFVNGKKDKSSDPIVKTADEFKKEFLDSITDPKISSLGVQKPIEQEGRGQLGGSYIDVTFQAVNMQGGVKVSLPVTKQVIPSVIPLIGQMSSKEYVETYHTPEFDAKKAFNQGRARLEDPSKMQEKMDQIRAILQNTDVLLGENPLETAESSAQVTSKTNDLQNALHSLKKHEKELNEAKIKRAALEEMITKVQEEYAAIAIAKDIKDFPKIEALAHKDLANVLRGKPVGIFLAYEKYLGLYGALTDVRTTIRDLEVGIIDRAGEPVAEATITVTKARIAELKADLGRMGEDTQTIEDEVNGKYPKSNLKKLQELAEKDLFKGKTLDHFLQVIEVAGGGEIFEAKSLEAANKEFSIGILAGLLNTLCNRSDLKKTEMLGKSMAATKQMFEKMETAVWIRQYEETYGISKK